MAGSGGYGLHCSVCEDSFTTRAKWVNHLTQSSHQRVAMSQCHQWADTEKECAVIVFVSSEEVVLDVPMFFTKGNTIVTDFILNKIRPRVAIMQFESSEKVTEELAKLKSSSTKIKNNKVQLKRATECLVLEWQEFLPSLHHNINVANQVSINTSNEWNAKLEQFSTIATNISLIFEKKKLKGILLQKFRSICNDVLIPKPDFNNALLIVEKLKNIFQPCFPNASPAEVEMFRHWYLGINGVGTNELLIFGYTHALTKLQNFGDGSNTSTGHSVRSQILSSPDFTDDPLILSQTKLPSITVEDASNGYSFVHIPSALKFRFICNILLLPEVQTCRMVNYLCKFDSRVLPLLTLVNYWAKTNVVEFGSLKVTSFSFPNLAPEPAALEWLVMFFLMRRRIVPCVRDILMIPHSTINFTRFKSINIDIGFEPDAKFCMEWVSQNKQNKVECNSESDEFVIHILQLLQDFFAFYTIENYFRNYVLNMIDGEIIHKAELIDTSHENKHVTNLTSNELKVIKSSLHRAPLILVHPLSTLFSLSFLPNKFIGVTRHMMSESAQKLNDFLVGFNDIRDSAAVSDLLNINLKSLFQCEQSEGGEQSVRVSESKASRKRKRNQSESY